MKAVARSLRLVLIVAVCLPYLAGCAGAGGGGRGSEIPNDPKLICDELREIRNDIANVEELVKGTKAQLNLKEDPNLRSELRSLEMELYHLQSQERALEERRTELGIECDT